MISVIINNNSNNDNNRKTLSTTSSETIAIIPTITAPTYLTTIAAPSIITLPTMITTIKAPTIITTMAPSIITAKITLRATSGAIQAAITSQKATTTALALEQLVATVKHKEC